MQTGKIILFSVHNGRRWDFFTEEYKDRYFKELGIPRGNGAQAPKTPGRRDQVKDALDTAHRIREFEIELYWKRTLYMWGVTAALLAIFALVVSNSPDQAGNSLRTTQLLLGGMISLMALVISILWALMAQGAKFWQNNWERHVDLLEEEYGVNLYKVYPVDGGAAKAPYSVTKINKAMVYTIIGFWLVSFLAIVALLAKKWGVVGLPDRKLGFGGALLIAYVAGCLTLIFAKLRMSNPGTQIFPTEPSERQEPVIRSRRQESSD